MALGIDISTFQGAPDFGQVKAQKEFVMVRSSYGVGYKDNQLDRSRNELRSRGIAHGFYHYAYPQYNTPENEAQWFLDVVGNLEKGEVLALDMEEVWSNFDDWRNWAAIFLEYIKNKIGYKPLLYINLSKATQGDWGRVVRGDFGLWLALWDGSTDSLPQTQWPVVAMKQYSATGSVAGISGDVDEDVFNGGIEIFKLYGYQPPAPAPDVIVFQVLLNGSLLIESGDENQARAKFGDQKNAMVQGANITLLKVNKTRNTKDQLDSYTRPFVPVTVFGVDLSKTAGVEFEFNSESDAVNAFAIQKSEMVVGETIDLLKITRMQGLEDVVVRLDRYTKPEPLPEPEEPSQPTEPGKPSSGFNLILFIINFFKRLWKH